MKEGTGPVINQYRISMANSSKITLLFATRLSPVSNMSRLLGRIPPPPEKKIFRHMGTHISSTLLFNKPQI
jgi:hypothetical protein